MARTAGVYPVQMAPQIWLALALAAAAAGPPPLCMRVTPAVDPLGGRWRVQLLQETPEDRKPVDESPSGADGLWETRAARRGGVAADRPHFQATFDVKVDPVFRDGTPPDVEVRVKSRAIAGEIVDGNNRAVPLSSLHVYGGGRFSDDMEVPGGAFRWERVVDGWMSVYASPPPTADFR